MIFIIFVRETKLQVSINYLAMEREENQTAWKGQGDWDEHIELLKKLSKTFLQKADELIQEGKIKEASECVAEGRKCVELALKFRLVTKSLTDIETSFDWLEVENEIGQTAGTIPISLEDEEDDSIIPTKEEE